VFDAAAKSGGKCLNDFITCEPALQNPLPASVIGFREGDIGWSADIGAMFSRIRLKDIDRPLHRFLWPEEDLFTSICEMTRVTFGVPFSPYVAIGTTWRAADNAGPDMKEAGDGIRSDIYVDDYLASADKMEDTVRKETGVKKVLVDGNFHLGHWVNELTLNPADAATRSQLEEDEIPSWWLDGPAFLYEEESGWPTDLPWMAAKEELRSIHVHFNLTAAEQSMARGPDISSLPALILLEGEFLDLVKRSQQEAYPEELKKLQQKKMLRP